MLPALQCFNSIRIIIFINRPFFMTCLINLGRQFLRSYSHTQEKKKSYYIYCSQRCNRNHVLFLKVMQKGKYRLMHLFSLRTQLLLCNTTERNQGAVSQLNCRDRAFFFFFHTEVNDVWCQYLPIAFPVSGGDFQVAALQYLGPDKAWPNQLRDTSERYRAAKWFQALLLASAMYFRYVKYSVE